jgi:hypothetical protein
MGHAYFRNDQCNDEILSLSRVEIYAVLKTSRYIYIYIYMVGHLYDYGIHE